MWSRPRRALPPAIWGGTRTDENVSGGCEAEKEEDEQAEIRRKYNQPGKAKSDEAISQLKHGKSYARVLPLAASHANG